MKTAVHSQSSSNLTENDVPAMAGNLQELLSEISTRVGLADNRYVDIISEMQNKLAALDALAKSARQKAEETARLEAEAKRKADEEAEAEAKRIEESENARRRTEEAEAAEAERLAKAVQAAKAAATAAIESSAARAYQPEVDTFDIIDHAPVRTREPWDKESANVFIRHFEQVETPGMLQPRRPGGMFYPEPQTASRNLTPVEPAGDRVWLEGRFNDIAARISEMMTHGSTRELGHRFEHLETRIDAAMLTVTTQAETGADTLKQIEAHIAEIDDHVDYIRKELSRLDVVEAHIRSLMEKAEAESASAALPAPPPAADHNAEGIIQLTGLLQRLVAERKHTEEHTISMLDTLQLAMIRVLDRMDAIEAVGSDQDTPVAAEHAAQQNHDLEAHAEQIEEPEQLPPSAPQIQAAHHHAAPAPQVHQQQQAARRPAQPPAFYPQQQPQQPDYFDFEHEDSSADLARAAQMAANEAAHAQSASVGQIRRNFISDAQRVRHPAQGADSGTIAAQTGASRNALPLQTRTTLLERLMRPTSRQLAIAALGLMIPLNAMFLYLVLGSSRSGDHGDVQAATETTLTSNRLTEASQAGDSEPPVSRPAEPLPAESLSRISPPVDSQPIAHQSSIVDGPAESGAIEMPPATVGPLTLRRAAADGDPSAQFEVAARLAEGKGIDQDFKSAVLWYQRSASRGFAQSQYRIGTHYERGLGVEKDPERARVWYQRAAEQGNVKAMHNLAVLTTNRPDSKPDYPEAVKWFTEAAAYNLPDSQFNLAVLHENGLGVSKDPKTAYVWFSLAARSGDREAVKRRDSVKAQLSADAVAAADEEVRNFRAKVQLPAINDPRVAGEQWKRRQVTEN